MDQAYEAMVARLSSRSQEQLVQDALEYSGMMAQVDGTWYLSELYLGWGQPLTETPASDLRDWLEQRWMDENEGL